MESKSFKDFEPRSQWMHGDDSDTLIVDVRGFSKEQMKVTISTSGRLKISGERVLDGNQRLRFTKTYAAPKNSNPKQIQAKFDKEEGLLYVVLPKHVNTKTQDFAQGTGIVEKYEEKIGLGVNLRKKRVVIVSMVIAFAVLVGIGSYLGWRYGVMG